MKIAWVLSVMGLLGCGGTHDPCEGLESCISARVEGTVTGLDQLRVKLVGRGDMLSPTPAAVFTLPVKLAIVMPAGATMPAAISIEGLSAGQTLAASDVHMITLGAGIPAATDTFTLVAGGPTDGGGNGDGPPPGVVSWFPMTVDFGTAARGTGGASKPVTLFNNTDHNVMITGLTTSGDDDQFSPTTGTTCFGADAGNMPMVSVAAHQSCDIAFQFLPSRSGSLKMDLISSFDDGEMAGFSLTGKATPVWVAETIPGSGGPNPDLFAVFGTGTPPNQQFVTVGHDPSGISPIFRSDGKGNWFRPGGTPNGTGDLFTIFGADLGHQFVGGSSGLIWSFDGNASWQQQTSADGGFIGAVRGLWSRNTNVSFAVTDAGAILRYDGNANSWSQTNAALMGQSFFGVCGHGQRSVAVGSQMIGGLSAGLMWSTDVNGASWSQSTESVLNSAVRLRGCWMPDDNNVYIVGEPAPGNNRGFITHCSGVTLTCLPAESPGSSMGPLMAVSGRVDPGNMKPDIWAVGAIGNQVLHTDGSGTWSQIQTPQNQAMQGVYVTPLGEVIAVGYTGQVNHLY